MATKKKADLTKDYSAAIDSIIEGKPVRKGAPVNVKGMTEERLQAYLDADLLTTPEDESKEADATNNATDATAAKRTEK